MSSSRGSSLVATPKKLVHTNISSSNLNLECKCEMKISPAILINKKYITAIRDFWPSKVNVGSQNCNPEDATTPRLLLRSWENARSMVNKETGLAPDS